MLLSINPTHPQPRKIRQVVETLERGGVIGYPTDTIYGIGCSIYQPSAIRRVYEIKGYDPNRPLSFICCDLKDISQYAQVTNSAYKIMRKLVPGPYTFILKATRLVPKIMLTKRKTVGIRVPNNAICQAIVRELGHPIITTSISTPDEQLYNDPRDIHDRLRGRLDLVIDGGTLVAEHSSIIDLTEDVPKVVRAGKGDVSFLMTEKE
jgi:tRNA threonylcarbamoyl adenosine modification protein (Sua5/YciO/YrdC/YwlC family)